MKKMLIFPIIFVLVIFFANASTESEAKDAINKAQKSIDSMGELGLGIQRVTDLMSDAKLSLESKDYDRAVEASNEINSLKEHAMLLDGKISQTKDMLDAAGNLVGVSEEKELLEKIILQFNEDNYEAADSWLLDLEFSLDSKLKSEAEKIKTSLDLEKNSEFSSESIGILSEKINDVIKSSNFSLLFALKNEADYLILALNGLHEAKNQINEMSNYGFKTSKINELFNDAEIMFELANYQKSYDLSREVIKMKELSDAANSNIFESEQYAGEVEKQGFDVSASRELILKSKESFDNEDYESALAIAVNAKNVADKSKQDALLLGVINKKQLKFNIIEFVKKNFFILLASIALVALVSYPASFAIRKSLFERKIVSLSQEEHAITSLIRKTQEDYFKNKKLSRMAYDDIIDKHQERILRIREARPMLRLKIEKNGQKLSLIKNTLRKLIKGKSRNVD